MTGSRYRLSFTTGGLLSQESAMAAEIYLRTLDWDLTRDKIRAENLLQVRTASASVRISRELIGRLELLSNQELQCVVDGTIRERGYLLWLAACRRYEFIRDFAVEVLREYFLTLRQVLSKKDFDAFFNAKAMWHEELDNTTLLTQDKLRQNLFRMMRDADLISPDNMIQPAMLTPRVASLMSAHGRDEFTIFPLSDTDISRWLK